MQKDRHQEKKGKPEQKIVTITINGQAVEMPKDEASGAEIKEAAISQGVTIELDFSLFLKEKDGLEPVRDSEKVRLKKNLEFTAVAPDDVS